MTNEVSARYFLTMNGGPRMGKELSDERIARDEVTKK